MRFLAICARLLTSLALTLVAVWVAGAIWFQGPALPALRYALIAVSIAAFGFALIGIWRRPRRVWTLAYAAAFAAMLLWWSTITPSATRLWSPEVAETVTATIEGDIATVSHVRNFNWTSLDLPADPAARRWETRRYNLRDVQGVDVVSLYWMGPAIGHTYFSFTFRDGTALMFSAEVRKEESEPYSSIAGFFKVFELAILAGDERDFIGWRVYAPGEDIQMFRTNASPAEARALLEGMLRLGNDIAASPRFYNTITANCTTEIWMLADHLGAGLPLDWRTILSGYVPDYLYDLQRLDTSRPLSDLREKGRLQGRAKAALDQGLTGAAFSQALRNGVPNPVPRP